MSKKAGILFDPCGCACGLRTGEKAEAFRVALQTLGDLTVYDASFFGLEDSRGYVGIATEVASDDSRLIRTIASTCGFVDAVAEAFQMSPAGEFRKVDYGDVGIGGIGRGEKVVVIDCTLGCVVVGCHVNTIQMRYSTDVI